MKKVMARSTGEVFQAERTEKGAKVYRLNGEFVREFAESTFKKYFKPVKDEATQEQPKAEVKPEPKAEPKAENKKAEAPKKESKKAEPKSDKATEEPQVEAKEQPVEIDDEKKGRLIEKIKKMLALADNNPSQEEALAAALQAQKLMAKYNIHEDEVTLEEIKDDIDSFIVELKHDSSFHAWRKSLASIIARNFRCKCYLLGGDVVFRGYRADAEIAREVFTSLYAIGDKLGSKAYHELIKQTGSGKGAYNSFIAGFLTGIQEGFSVQCTALLVITPKAVEEEFEQFSKNFGTSKVRITSCNQKLFEQGKAEGKAAVKARQLEEK